MDRKGAYLMKQKHMQGLCALFLCGALLTPALAAEPAETEETDGPDLTWEELDERILAGSLNVRILDENIGSIEAIDYEMMEEQLRQQLNQIADAQWFLIQTGNSASASSLDETYSSLREVFDDIRDGDLQKDYADAVRQIEDGIHQVLAAGESLYINLVSLEASLEDGNRGLAALDRSLEELRLRRDLGQVSDQQVAALEQTRADTVSQLRTLETTIATYKSQLQVLIGEEPTGELTLGPLPEEAALEWTEPDYEADLAAAKEASWTSPWRTPRRPGRMPAGTTMAATTATSMTWLSTPGTPPRPPTRARSRTSRPASAPSMTPWRTMSRCGKTSRRPWTTSRPC